jgi:hypothetical protein
MPFRALAASALALVLCCVAPARSRAAAPPHAQPPSAAPPKVPVHPVGPPHGQTALNPHLHVKTVPPATATPGHPTPTAHPKDRPTTVFRGRNSGKHSGFVRPTYVHPHGLGQIVGTVRTAEGAPVRGAWVRLARLRGGRLRRAAARHDTYTDSSGRFVMRAVKSGRFRAVGSRRDLGRGFVLGAMNPGGFARVTIAINHAGRRPA